MERIVFLERNTVQANFRRPDFDHEWIEYGESLQDQIVDRLRGATIVISNKLALREPDLARLPELKLIAIAATGFDCVDLDYCRSHNIAVCNVRGYAANSVSRSEEHTSELQSLRHLVCRLLLEKKKKKEK